jgi:hypothetical protein
MMKMKVEVIVDKPSTAGTMTMSGDAEGHGTLQHNGKKLSFTAKMKVIAKHERSLEY